VSAILLRGINGANPLGYLAALGALRLLSLGNRDARLRWVRDGLWRPEIVVPGDMDESGLCEALLTAPSAPAELFVDSLGKNITVGRTVFEVFIRRAHDGTSARDRRIADFAAAFGSEACDDEKKGRIEYTPLCFITGSGHQDFLETMRSLKNCVTTEHLRATLFEPWRYTDKGFSMRWDPGDAREYALRWNNPGPEGAWTVWGANRLAIEALPLFPSYPQGRILVTTGFRRLKGGVFEFTWPLWTSAVSCDCVGGLVGMEGLAENSVDREKLAAMGVDEVYRSQRIRIGAGANFKTSFRPARAV
jgi:hypothetical protein